MSPLNQKRFEYKKQKFQEDAVCAVINSLKGITFKDFSFDIFSNTIKENVAKVQKDNHIVAEKFSYHDIPFDASGNPIERKKIKEEDIVERVKFPVFDIHMETGTGKTFTLINTIFELNKEYGLTHFIVVVPSIAIKEGIKKSFNTTSQYFKQIYHKSIITNEYKGSEEIKKNQKNKRQLPNSVFNFIESDTLSVLIMTNHAFNKESNLIHQEIEGCLFSDGANTAINSIANKKPVMIIDEPQRVLGKSTKKLIPYFKPSFMLRYSATFKDDDKENLLYSLDSYDAFKNKLVKNIEVYDYKVSEKDSDFIYLKDLQMKDGKHYAYLDVVVNGVVKTVKASTKEADLYKLTNNKRYQGITIEAISVNEGYIRLNDNNVVSNGLLKLGDVVCSNNHREILDRIMIRETIKKHFEKESFLFTKNIKCISLFFVDKVADYRDFDAVDEKGKLQKIFEEEYNTILKQVIDSDEYDYAYKDYLRKWSSDQVHGGYFSKDKKKSLKLDESGDKNNKEIRDIKEQIYNWIMKDKEKTLNINNNLRFIFAHSALREGWDNPNIFQICKMRNTYSDISRVQEVGRGLRISVNSDLKRMDFEAVGSEFNSINKLSVFTLGDGTYIDELQSEFRQRRTNQKLVLIDPNLIQNIYSINQVESMNIFVKMTMNGVLSADYSSIDVEKAKPIFEEADLKIEKLTNMVNNAVNLSRNVTNGRNKGGSKKTRKYKVNKEKYRQFSDLWNLLHQNIIYDITLSNDFIDKVSSRLNKDFKVSKIYINKFKSSITDFNDEDGKKQSMDSQEIVTVNMGMNEFLEQLVRKTKLSKNLLVNFLKNMENEKFQQIKNNPYKAIDKLSELINIETQKYVLEKIEVKKMEGIRNTYVDLSNREFEATNYLLLEDVEEYNGNYLFEDIAPYDSEDPERDISEQSLTNSTIKLFAKLPKVVNIPTPFGGKVNPDFGFVLENDEKNQLYFVAEAKPTSTYSEKRRGEENLKIEFAKKYFESLNEPSLSYEVVENYEEVKDLISSILKKEE